MNKFDRVLVAVAVFILMWTAISLQLYPIKNVNGKFIITERDK